MQKPQSEKITKIHLTKEKLREVCGEQIFSRGFEYVCSKDLRKRVVFKNSLFAEVRGNYGVYKTQLLVAGDKIYPSCTCPAEMYFCKHAVALGLTWIKEPQSFLNVEDLLKSLKSKTKAELIDIIRQMVVKSQNVLSVFGIKEFEDYNDEEEEEYFDDEDNEMER